MASTQPTALPNAGLMDPVTAHVRRDYYALYPEQTVEEALATMRAFPPTGRIIYFYVLDNDHRLQGVVPTRRLLLSALEAKISEIMIRNVITIPGSATVMEALEFFGRHKLLAFPVVDEFRRLIGVIDVELYTDELEEIGKPNSDQVFQLIGMTLGKAQQANPLIAFRGRFPWLLCNVGGGLLAAFLSGIYDDTLQWHSAVLALFIPVVLALAESVSIQSVTLALDTLRHDQPTWKKLFKRLLNEMQTGLLLGLGTGILVAVTALIWKGLPDVASCILGGILGGVTAAALLGIAIPNVLRLLKRDPQLAAGPIALAGTDMVTLLVYFNLARMLMRASGVS
ncbi:magnesium transporter [Tuwongella immobilis]|uniref:CBS domain-containing protein n=1 Tax=Tuwongella immobilis TaxID=692036 RepID=A0A6C2YWE2_9BACT|nr:magnesium transporter [Tuwongella immobilis]VIP05473.1 magnesium transporter : CBS domain containing protein OS=Pirellula staleyi (strain ATCC 27377 / DSM 6068 / ICPB 4128) GN=Psta_1776 PE=4 SV=1: CBS: CBS: MgtE [Tuwongella immobilis]VTS08302.1 magnesium transporter : CBS domain containing protein OS=Pirellula staleyi (strain ATCC 27377 / DSM 6068 / ICPB 4128) GN=Psta_1776 PE=4 SV=1: CBS: CBS: MgtE [Tuwongella immobilis]